MTGRLLPLIQVLLASTIVLSSCKLKSSVSKTKDQDDDLQETSVQVGTPIPNQLQLFARVLNGTEKRMHDAYFSTVLPSQLTTAKFTKDVGMTWKEQFTDSSGNYNIDHTDTYRGIVIGPKILVFRKEIVMGGVAEKGPWWYPVSAYPRSILGDNVSIEDKIKYCLHTKIYEKREIGEALSMVSSAEFFFSLLPGYSGAEKVFYGNGGTDKVVGTLWIIGDVATLGMSCKVKAIAKASTGVVIGTVALRSAVLSSELQHRPATLADVANLSLLTVEGGLAAFSGIKLLTNKPRASGLDSSEVIARTFEEKGTVAVKDAASAESLGKLFNRSSDEILKSGLLKEEVEQLVGRKLTQIGERINGRLILPEELVQNSVLIQIERIKGTLTAGHMSIRIGGLAVHADGPGAKVVLRQGTGERLRNEITVFKLDVPPEQVQVLKDKLASSPVLGTGSLGCANASVQVLEEVVGVTVQNPSWLYGKSTYNTIRDLLAKDLVNKNTGARVGYTIYSSHLANSDALLKQAAKTDKAVVAVYGTAGAGLSVVTYLIGNYFYTVVDSALANEIDNVDPNATFQPVDANSILNQGSQSDLGSQSEIDSQK